MAKPTDELLNLAFFTLVHAVKSVINSSGPLIPFVIIESASGERTLARFMSGKNPEEARQHARAHVAQTIDCQKYAIAAEGTVTENGQRIPVVMVEVGQRSEPHGFAFIQRFSSTATCTFAQAMRNPGIIDHPAILRPPGQV